MNKDKNAHRRPWLWANEEGQEDCCYCRVKFSEANPPTFDHVIPKSKGGTLLDGRVICCQLCNSSRGPAPHDQYMKAVEQEWLDCIKENRQYRRPKYRAIRGNSTVVGVNHVLTTLSRREWREEQRLRCLAE